MSIQDRLTDPQYQNWLKGGQALLIVLNGLRQFADKTINDYHGQLKTQLGDAKCPQQCKATKDPGKCPVCDQWKQQMMLNHSNKIVFWKNVDPKLWPSRPWEMAKFYMPRGQKHSVPITANDLDSTHMFNLLKNCKEFHQFFSNKNLPQKVLSIRNKLMHSSNMTVEDAKLKTAFDELLQFLEDKIHLQNLPEVKAAVKEMKELQNMTFALIIGGQQAQGPIQQPSMTLETAKHIEETLIKDVMGDFEARLISLESLSNDATERSGNEDSNERLSETIAEWQEFVNDNADLKMKFGKDLQGIKGRCDLLEQRVAEINIEVDVLGVRVDALESAPPSGTKPAASYKNLLQEITANLKIDKPVYNCVHEEHGHRCTVTVDGTPYQTSKFCNSKKEAEQNVAELAYRIMKVKPKQSEQEKGKTADGTNYVGQLQEYQQSRSLPKPEYHPKTTENIKFTASVILELPGGSDRKFETQDVENSVREAKHAVAKLALKALQSKDQKQEQPKVEPEPLALRALQSKDQKQEQLKVEPEPAAVASPMGTADPDVTESSGTNYKGKLQERQQKLGLAAPTYTITQDGNDRFQSTVTVLVNKEDASQEFEGEMAEGGKKEAEHRAAKIALASLGGVDKSSALGVGTLPKTSTDLNPMPHKAKPSKDLNPMPDNGDEQGECASGISFISKLQERQQKLDLPLPTYTIKPDGLRFQSKVTVPVNKEGASQEFEGEMAEGSKKDAKHRAAEVALASLDGVEDGTSASVLPNTDSVCKASPKSDKTNDEQPRDLNTEPGTNYKGELQELLQQFQGITNLPKYEDIEIQSAPGTYRSQVTLTTKYILQNNERHSSKKEAEKKTAELALKKLGIPGVDTHIANPKGKLQELSPSSKVFYETVEVGKSFHCTLISSILETENEVVVYADRDGRTKKERKEMQQVAARKVLDWLKKVQN